MHWKSFVFANLLCLVSANDKHLINAITSILLQDQRPISLLIPNICWHQYQVTSMAKRLAEAGINIANSLQKNRHDFFLQNLVLMVDLSCPGTEDFIIRVNEDGYFKAPYRWLILDHDKNRSAILNEVEILIDSDVILIIKSGNEEYEFLEAYKIDKNSEIIYTARAIWRPLRIDFNKSNQTNLMSNTDTLKGMLEDHRESRVLSSKRNNLRRQTLTMINVITDSNETREHLTDRLQLQQDIMTKVSYTIAQICFEMLNASVRLTFTHTWGYKDKNGNWQGVIDSLIKKKADLGTITIFTKERMEVIDFIAMIGSTNAKFIFREPPLSYISNVFTLPFSDGVWLAILVCVLSCAVFIYIASKWEASTGMHQFQLNGTWADVIILIIGAVLQQGCTLEPRYAAGRVVTLHLFLALTFLYAAYCANIVVLLKAPSSSIRTLDALLHSPLKLGASDFEYNRYFFKKLQDPVRKAIYTTKIAPKGKKGNYYSVKEGVEKIRQDLFAFHVELNSGYRLIQETYQEHEKCHLVEMDYINVIGPWLPGQKRSALKELYKINFIKIREAGLQDCIYRRLHVTRPRCSGTVSTFSSVGITDMYPAMLATLYGTLLAPAVLLLEMVYYRLTVMKLKNQQKQRSAALTFHN